MENKAGCDMSNKLNIEIIGVECWLCAGGKKTFEDVCPECRGTGIIRLDDKSEIDSLTGEGRR